MTSLGLKQHWEQQREMIKKLREQGRKNSEIAEILGITENMVYKHKAKMGKETKKELVQDLKQDTYLQDIDKKNAKTELLILKKKYWEVLEELEKKELMYDTWDKLHKLSSDIKIEKTSSSNKSESTAVILASDWHIEETINPETINYLNEYNPQIAKQRAEKFRNNWLKLVDMMAKDERIDKVVLWLLGDFISWYIHSELMEDNQMSPTEAILYVKALITWGIDMFLENSSYDMTIVTAFGNHWRTTDKKRISTWWKNSYEWMMYNLIAQQYEKNDRVKMKVEKWYHNYLNVYDKVLRFHHWDWMKYQWGVGWITIPVNKAISQRNKAKRADIDCFWHRHQNKDGWIRVSNGSLIWYWPYAESIKADYEEPKQAMFLLNDKYWKTISAPVLLV